MTKVKYTSAYFFIFIIFPVILLQRFPTFFSLDGFDNGIFAYIGDMMLQGQIYYRDIWEHKTPLLFFLHMFTFKIFGSHMKSIAVMELIWLFGGSIVFYRLAKFVFARRVSIACALLFAVYMSSVPASSEFGMAEIYLEICAVISILALFRFEKNKTTLLLILSGIFASFAFLFKQPGAVMVLPCYAFIILSGFTSSRKFKSVFKDLVIWGISFFLPILLLAVYYYANSALYDAIDQVFKFNFIYSKEPSLFEALGRFFSKILINWGGGPLLIITAVSGFICAAVFFIKDFKNKNVHSLLRKHRFFLLFSVWFAAGFYAVGFSGRYYDHYFIQVVASLSLFAGYAICLFFKNFKNGWLQIFVTAVLILIATSFLENTENLFKMFKMPSVKVNGLVYKDFKKEVPLIYQIQKGTSKDDYVYFWGAQSRLNFITRRKSPTRYHHIFPLTAGRYTTISHIAEFIGDLDENKPKYIVDVCGKEKTPCLIDDTAKIGMLVFARIYILSHYNHFKIIGNWHIYKRKIK